MDTVTLLRSYRCNYIPTSPLGTPIACESGILPYVQVKAANAENAHHRAHHVTGQPVAEVFRMEPVAGAA